jgi:hypothetical protein
MRRTLDVTAPPPLSGRRTAALALAAAAIHGVFDAVARSPTGFRTWRRRT